MKMIELDQKGYFLIRINQETKGIEIAFCRYDKIAYTHPKARFGRNTIEKTFSSRDPEEILKWIEENRLYKSEDHRAYMKKELYKAKECLEKGIKYIQS